MTYGKFSMAGMDFSACCELDLSFGLISEKFSSDSALVDAEFFFVPQKCEVNGTCLFEGEVYSVYENDEYTYRKFNENIGGFVLKREKSNPDKAWIYGDADELKRQENALLRGYLGIEIPFVQRHTFILHSSIIKTNDCAVVFCGPSKIGKSTQASLWQQYKGAEILNGDRTCIRNTDNGAVGYGSFFAGSSQIYRNESAPIKAIVVLGQSSQNTLESLSASEAFSHIYAQTLNNPWDKNFVSMLMSEIEKTVSNIPVYKLNCLPDFSAVDLLYNELFNNN